VPLLVGSRGTLGFLGEVILRTRPRARFEQWYTAPSDDPWSLVERLYRPTSVLWDGTTTWVLLEGDRRDVEEQAASNGLTAADAPVDLPTGGRWSVPPAEAGGAARLRPVRGRGRGRAWSTTSCRHLRGPSIPSSPGSTPGSRRGSIRRVG
jgi:hypothetical protein